MAFQGLWLVLISASVSYLIYRWKQFSFDNMAQRMDIYLRLSSAKLTEMDKAEKQMLERQNVVCDKLDSISGDVKRVESAVEILQKVVYQHFKERE